ncbi:hypothetical protein ACO22_06278 [Paracoccidioides brasiliensis]|uniref:Copper-fist domain-containing protein n=1 Tax=Paracoccidioides brasiliensis TaxID=121759 RepID=A0A1D2J7W1_PARBR|nr:hypothetical protein ACO22_06278 [Paracoccidioides brasiliensis]
MPLDEEGAKWSWYVSRLILCPYSIHYQQHEQPFDSQGNCLSSEPCVRGHRSSKCQHFDRLMMKVPKAGRPLAKCPHPKGTCSCQKLYAFMVRIPKGSSCLCRPLYQVPMVVTESGTSVKPVASLPAASASSIANTNRIQKRSSRRSSLQTAPELVAKVVDEMETASNDNKVSSSPARNVRCSHKTERYFLPPRTSADCSNGQSPNGGLHLPDLLPTQPQAQGSALEPPSTNDGCCASRKPMEPSSQPSRSCCSTNSPKSEEFDATVGEFKQEDGARSSQQPNPHQSAQTIPPDRNWEHGSFLTPDLSVQTQEQHNIVPHFPNRNSIPHFQMRGSSSTPVTGYPSPNAVSQYQPIHHPQSPFSSSNIPAVAFHSPRLPNDSQLHNCVCGDDCQCLGCASHPFNKTTREHVQQMGYLLNFADDDQQSERSDNNANKPSFDGPPVPAEFEYHNWSPSSLPFQNSHQLPWNGPHTRPTLNGSGSSPSGGPTVYSSNRGEMMMQPAAYYELEYPADYLDPCTNMTGTCQCGINCSCVGCLTHSGHDGVQLELSPPPDTTLEGAVTDTAKSVPPSTPYSPSQLNGDINSYLNHEDLAIPIQNSAPRSPLPA